MDNPWITHGLSLDYPWIIHGIVSFRAWGSELGGMGGILNKYLHKVNTHSSLTLLIRIILHHNISFLKNEPLLRQDVVLVSKPCIGPKRVSLQIQPVRDVDECADLFAVLPFVFFESVYSHMRLELKIAK